MSSSEMVTMPEAFSSPAHVELQTSSAQMRFTGQGRDPEDFGEICRLATRAPNEHLVERAVEQINTGQLDAQSATNTLCTRLRQVCTQGKREHKIVLALKLIEQILAHSRSHLDSHQQSQLMQEIGRVAILPMDRFAPDLQTAQDSKTLALKIISQYQQGPNSPKRRGSEGAGSATESPKQPRLTSQEAIQTCILRANAQIELVQEAVLAMSTNELHTISEGDSKFLTASVAALKSYKRDLEMSINFLASHEADTSASMMADCLKTVDAINTTMTLFKEVVEAKQQGGTAMEPSRAHQEHPTAPPAAAPQQQQQQQQQQSPPPPQQQPAQSQPPQADLLLPGFDTGEPQPRSANGARPNATGAPATEAMLKEMGWL